MKFRQIKSRPNSFLLLVTALCIFMLWSCGSGSSSNDSAAGSGGLSFKIAYHGAARDLQSKAAEMDCAGQGIATIEAKVYDSDNASIAGGGPWDCDAGQGTISSVPAGSDRTVVIFGKDADEKVIFSGQKSGIQVDAGSENNAGTIECFAFVPSLQAPADGSDAEGGAMVLEWVEVSGAAEYRVLVSLNSDLSDPIIDDTTSTTNFTPTGLSYRKTCYWRVFAIDAYGNSGNGSDIWSFRSPDNVSPFAQITCPADGIIYVEGDTITFTGSGSDVNDGDLSGESLVWSSDLYGPICKGETCASDLLSAGIHQISLTVTDSEDVSWTDTVTITVNAGSAVGSLPDTGQVTSYTETMGEDSDYTFNPPAYTKLDAAGNDLDACATEWPMVRDDVTGLVWEVKTDDGSIHDKDDKYDWEKDQEADLDAQVDFINRLNSEQFGGKSDWRLPTVKELSTIVSRENHNPTINTAYFPNTMPDLYWSSTTHHQQCCLDNAWGVDFNDIGYVYGGYSADDSLNRSSSNYVRAVRGGKEVSGKLVDNGDNTVTDTATGLMWQQLEALDDNGEVHAMTWEEALEYCKTLELGGKDDWRLPNVNELQSIADYEKQGTSIDTIFFKKAIPGPYWTATTAAFVTDYALCLFFYSGDIGQLYKPESHRDGEENAPICVRAVRNVQ